MGWTSGRLTAGLGELAPLGRVHAGGSGGGGLRRAIGPPVCHQLASHECSSLVSCSLSAGVLDLARSIGSRIPLRLERWESPREQRSLRGVGYSAASAVSPRGGRGAASA